MRRRRIFFSVILAAAVLLQALTAASAGAVTYPGFWTGYILYGTGEDARVTEVRFTLRADGSGEVELRAGGVTAIYPMGSDRRLSFPSPDPFPGFFPYDSISYVQGGWKQDADPIWGTMKVGCFAGWAHCYAERCSEKPYLDAALESFRAEGHALKATFLTDDEWFIRDEWPEYAVSGKPVLIRIESMTGGIPARLIREIAGECFLRTEDGLLTEAKACILPDASASQDAPFEEFDLVFDMAEEPEAVVCADQFYDPDTLFHATPIPVNTFRDEFPSEGSTQERMEWLQRNYLFGLPVLEGEPVIRGKLLIAQCREDGKLALMTKETYRPEQGGYAGWDADAAFPTELLAQGWDDADTVLLIAEDQKLYGYYSNGGTAVTTTTLLYAVDPAAMTIRGPVTIAVEKPPEHFMAGSDYRGGASGAFRAKEALQRIAELYVP